MKKHKKHPRESIAEAYKEAREEAAHLHKHHKKALRL